MFEKSNERYKIALIWLLVFIGLWIIFQKIFPIDSIDHQLNMIQESIENNNWEKANEYATQLKDNFRKNRAYIQMNNATEALTMFEYTIGQLEITVKNKEDSALEYIGALRESIKNVIIPFSGP